MKENEFQTKLKKALEQRNAFVTSFSGSRYQVGGIFDIHVQHNYWSGWLELKVDKNKPSPGQVQWGNQMSKRGANCLYVWFLNDSGNIATVRAEQYCGGTPAVLDTMGYRSACVADFVAKLLRERK